MNESKKPDPEISPAVSPTPDNPFGMADIPNDPQSVAMRLTFTAVMSRRIDEINRLLSAGHTPDTIIIVEHYGYPKISIVDDHVVVEDSAIVRLINETDSAFAKPAAAGVWVKTEIRNANDPIHIVRKKIEDAE